MLRRAFIQSLLAAAPKPRILLRSSWQTVNIGDIAHTPGVLALIEKYIPEAEVRLWPNRLDNGVEPLLLERFPKLLILRGESDIAAAIDQCDFLLHGSGASLVGHKEVARWRGATRKPFGVYGITLPSADPAVVELLSNARFAFFRDSVSLPLARDSGVRAPVMGLAPDGAFATDLRNDAAAESFLREHGLEPGRFLCCIPRLRFTPYWLIPSRNTPMNPERNARNEAMKEHDHAPLREAIAAVVSKTGLKVLLCPEDETQVAVGKEMLYDKLPGAIRERVVWRDRYWLTGEAISTYVRSAGLFGNEMHSPIMCIGHGIPAIVCRWAEQTSKGFMWRDIGLGDWLFDLDNPADPPRVAPAVLAMAKDPAAARRKALQARAIVQKRQQETMQVLAAELRRV
jgi:polysaccharide pyruvyl transferase WcaK-like protein